MIANPALKLAPYGRWTLRNKAAQRRLALRYVSKEIMEAFDGPLELVTTN